MKKLGRFLCSSVIALGTVGIVKHCYQVAEQERKGKEKNRMLMQMFIKWMDNKEQGKEIASYLNDLNIRTVAIYGMSDAGKKLFRELENTDVAVEYAIDRRAIETDAELNIITVEDELKPVDAIIVTAIYDFEDITEMLSGKTDAQIISLEQIVYELSDM